MSQNQPVPEWPKYFHGPKGRVRFDEPNDVWPGYTEAPPPRLRKPVEEPPKKAKAG